jgi:hypothetical protein
VVTTPNSRLRVKELTVRFWFITIATSPSTTKVLT